MKALGFVVSEEKIFLCFTHDAPGAGPVWTPGARLAGFIKRTTIHCSGPCGFGEEDFFMFFPCRPRGGPVWTPGARLAGFIKGTIIHCYTQNMKALGLVVWEKNFFFYVFPIVSLWELSVAMETRVLIRPGPKPNKTFPPP